MKKIILVLALILSACASHNNKPLPEEKGYACFPVKNEAKEVVCYDARLYQDASRFHYLRPWQKDSLEPMPDLP